MPITDKDKKHGYGPQSMYVTNFPTPPILPAQSPIGPEQDVPPYLPAQSPLEAWQWPPVDVGRMIPQWPPQPQLPNRPPTLQGQSTPPQPAPPTGVLDRMKAALIDPRARNFLLTTAAILGQPRQFGQTGWGQVAQALAGGYNSLAMARAMQAEAARQAREEARKNQELQIKAAEAQANIGEKGANAQLRKAEAETLPKYRGAQAKELEASAQHKQAQAEQQRAEAAAIPTRTAVAQGQLELSRKKWQDELAIKTEELAQRERELKEAERTGVARRDLYTAQAAYNRTMADVDNLKQLVAIANGNAQGGPKEMTDLISNVIRAQIQTLIDPVQEQDQVVKILEHAKEYKDALERSGAFPKGSQIDVNGLLQQELRRKFPGAALPNAGGAQGGSGKIKLQANPKTGAYEWVPIP